MDLINITLIFIISFLYGRLLKSTVNWLNIDGFTISNSDLKMELFCVGSWFWAFMNLQPMEGTIFALISGILFAISWIDFHISDTIAVHHYQWNCRYFWSFIRNDKF